MRDRYSGDCDRSRRPRDPSASRVEWMLPDDVLPEFVGFRPVVARTDETAMALTQVLAYPSGFEFVVEMRHRSRDFGGRTDHIWAPRLPDDAALVQVQFADEAVASNRESPWLDPFFDDYAPPFLMLRGSLGGGGRDWTGFFWVWPLPPPGAVEFRFEWQAAGVPRTSAVLQGEAIREAGARAQQLWARD